MSIVNAWNYLLYVQYICMWNYAFIVFRRHQQPTPKAGINIVRNTILLFQSLNRNRSHSVSLSPHRVQPRCACIQRLIYVFRLLGTCGKKCYVSRCVSKLILNRSVPVSHRYTICHHIHLRGPRTTKLVLCIVLKITLPYTRWATSKIYQRREKYLGIFNFFLSSRLSPFHSTSLSLYLSRDLVAVCLFFFGLRLVFMCATANAAVRLVFAVPLFCYYFFCELKLFHEKAPSSSLPSNRVDASLLSLHSRRLRSIACHTYTHTDHFTASSFKRKCHGLGHDSGVCNFVCVCVVCVCVRESNFCIVRDNAESAKWKKLHRYPITEYRRHSHSAGIHLYCVRQGTRWRLGSLSFVCLLAALR